MARGALTYSCHHCITLSHIHLKAPDMALHVSLIHVINLSSGSSKESRLRAAVMAGPNLALL